jgi:methionyl-tRNA formyltransferase
VDLLLGSDIGLWVAQVVRPVDVRLVITSDETIAAAANDRGMRVGTVPAEGHRALSVHYPRLLPASDLMRYDAVYNLHPGFLPWGRGHFPLVWAIWLGEPAGATLHRMVPRLDAGPIVDQRLVEVRDDETGHSLFQHIREAEHAMFLEWWPRLVTGHTPEERMQVGTGSYHDRKSFEDLLATDPASLTDQELDRLRRALTFPGKPGLRGSR